MKALAWQLERPFAPDEVMVHQVRTRICPFLLVASCITGVLNIRLFVFFFFLVGYPIDHTG